MATVREAAYDLLRARGMTTVFGNPGSTELPFLHEFPDDFTYVLGLQEAVVVGMADGYAQASGRAAHANLHTSPGVGNAMGAIFNAQANKAPLLITAGQQVRSMMTMEALLTNRDAPDVPRPFVKWSFEVPRAQEVPAALARGIHLAETAPRGPVFVSIPMDDWRVEADETTARQAAERSVAARTAPDPAAIGALAERLGAAESPVLVVGGEVDATGGWDHAVALAERLRMPVWNAPITNRASFPQDHPSFRGELPPGIALVSGALEGHDLVLVVGAPVFRYYPNVPGAFLPEGATLALVTDDPDEAARAPVGDALLGDPALALEALAAAVPEADRAAPEPRPAPAEPAASNPLSAAAALATLADVLPDDAILVNESPSNTFVLRDQVRVRRPGSYFFCQGGGLGWGLSAAVGVQLAQPERPVVAVVGDGSCHYAITALWTAAAHRAPLTVLVPRNEEYAILKGFSALEQVQGSPGLDVRGLDTVAVAEGYGVRARRVDGAEELRAALEEAIATDGPELVEVPIEPGMTFG